MPLGRTLPAMPAAFCEHTAAGISQVCEKLQCLMRHCSEWNLAVKKLLAAMDAWVKAASA